MPANVFISYSSSEYSKVYPIKQYLESQGISCWMAPGSIPGGSSYAAEIEAAIRSCDAFVLFLSENAQSSTWVTKELDRALNAGKKVIPYVMESITLNNDFSFYLTNVQWYPAFENEEKALKDMTDEIISVVEKKHGKIIKPVPEKETAAEATAEVTVNAEKAAVQTEAPVPKEKPMKKSKPGKAKKKKPGKSGTLRKILSVSGIIAAVIVIAAAAITIGNHIKIAGKTFLKSDKSISVISAALTDEDIEKINSLDLWTLELIDCGLTDEQAAKIDFSSMNDINLDHNQLTSLGFLSGTDKISRLSVCCNSLTDLSGIENDYKLEMICADNNSLSSLKGLENTTVLKKVCLADNSLSDFSLLASSASTLETLDISGNEAANIAFLSEAEKLQSVWADNNQIFVIDPLYGKQELSHISFSNNQLRKVSVFGSCPNLKYADLSGNSISEVDIEKLTPEHPEIAVIDLSGNWLAGSELKFGAEVKTLDIRGNRSAAPVLANAFDSLMNNSGSNAAAAKATGNNISNLYADFYPGMANDDYGNVYSLYIAGCPLNERIGIEALSSAVNFADEEEEESPAEKYRNLYLSHIGWQDKLNAQ